MKALIVGLGMIGEKHAGILSKYFGIACYTFGSKSSSKYIIRNLLSIKEVKEVGFDFIVISNPTSKHVESIIQFQHLGVPFFLEKPVDLEYENIKGINKNTKIYVAYCLRFTPVIQFLKKELVGKEINHIQIVNTNCLKAWPRKGSDSYSRYFEQGGGVVLDMSHEIDYLNYLTPIKSIKGFVSDKRGDFTKNAIDTLNVDFETKNGSAHVYLNYQGHVAKRELTIDFDNESWVADIKESKIYKYSKRELIDVLNLEGNYQDMYKNQWEFFLDNMVSDTFIHNFEKDKELFSILIRLNKKVEE